MVARSLTLFANEEINLNLPPGGVRRTVSPPPAGQQVVALVNEKGLRDDGRSATFEF